MTLRLIDCPVSSCRQLLMSLVNEQSDTMSDMGKIVLAVRYERTDALLRVLIQAAEIEGRIMIGLRLQISLRRF